MALVTGGSANTGNAVASGYGSCAREEPRYEHRGVQFTWHEIMQMIDHRVITPREARLFLGFEVSSTNEDAPDASEQGT